MKKINVNVSTDKVKDYLMSRIDNTNPVEVEKVGRYIKHIEMYRKMDAKVKKEGVSTLIENGAQKYIKAHPLLSEMNKINASLLSLEKSFNFLEDDEKDEEIELI